MGYTTTFEGQFQLNKQLSLDDYQWLADFHEEAHQEHDSPGGYCQWVPTKDGRAIQWDQAEKFYHYTDWLVWLVAYFFTPRGYALNGTVRWQGEDGADVGRLVVEDNAVRAETGMVVARETPKYRQVLEAITAERRRQDAKHGGPAHDDQHEPVEWRQFIGEHAFAAITADREDEQRQKIIETAALGYAVTEALARSREASLLGTELGLAQTWAAKTFPRMTRASVLTHLQEEVAELLEAETNGDYDEQRLEAADVALLVAIYALVAGFDLGAAVAQKMRTNRVRRWDPLTGRHLKEGGQ